MKEFKLPKKWHVKVTRDNWEVINKWKQTTVWKERASSYLYVSCTGEGTGINPDYKDLITFEQFKKYVLKEDSMKKEVKLTEEQAKQLYKEHPEWRSTLLSEFSDEELDIDNFPKSWEDLKKVRGFYINEHAEIKEISSLKTYNDNKNIFPTEEDAKKALAEAQLRQLAYKINGEKNEDWVYSEYPSRYAVIFDKRYQHLTTASHYIIIDSDISFKNRKDAEKSIKYHKDLWYDYLKVPENLRT